MTKVHPAILIGLPLWFGCQPADPNSEGGTTTTANTTIASNTEIPTTSSDETFSNDLSDGEIFDTSWAALSNIACWIGTEDDNDISRYRWEDILEKRTNR